LTQSKLYWLNGESNDDIDVWINFWEESVTRRPHDHPGYLRALATPDLTPMAVLFEHPTGATIFYAFYLRSLNNLEFIGQTICPLFHIVSPYGYGGPIYQGQAKYYEEISAEFESAFNAVLQERGVISEFVREDIFQERLAIRLYGRHVQQQLNAVVRLDRAPEEHWRNYKHKVRKNVKKAISSGLKVVFDSNGEYLDEFLKVYYNTMERTGAGRSFFFAKECFELLGLTLGASGGLTYVHVFEGERMISTELLLLSPDTIYSFLGGTLASEFDKRPNDLLKHETILWGRRQGLKYYVLGGGVSPGDGIFAYKEAFDPGSVYAFFIREVQHDIGKYNQLTQLRKQFEAERGIEWKQRPDFFPAYLS